MTIIEFIDKFEKAINEKKDAPWKDIFNRVIIPEKVCEIWYDAFRNDKSIISVNFPASVKQIQARAFWGCTNLKKITFNEGLKSLEIFAFSGCENLSYVELPSSLEEINAHAFDGCSNLKEIKFHEGLKVLRDSAFADCKSLSYVVLPDSLKNYTWAFKNCTGLKREIWNTSHTILYCCPEVVSSESYAVPDGTLKIADCAFAFHKNLRSVTLPEGLQEISYAAFRECGFTEIVIPSSVNHIKSNAFYGCSQLSKVIICGKDTVVEAGAFTRCSSLETIQMQREISLREQYRLRGMNFLFAKKVLLPSREYLNDEKFLHLAERIGANDNDAMYAMSEYFDRKSDLSTDFFAYAANFWRYRAYCKGNSEAKKWIEEWFAEHPYEQLPSVLTESLDVYNTNAIRTEISGALLNQLGFLFFDYDRKYILYPDNENVVEVSSYCGEDGPDEDGFGSETFDDWWYLDDNLSPVPGVKMFHSLSYNSKSIGSWPKEFKHEHDLVVMTIKKRDSVL